jgi:hypothetical protein
VHVLDCESDEVFVVDFEGGDELLRTGRLAPQWRTFYEFLAEYFS